MQSGSEVGIFFFSCLAFTIVLYVITRWRVKYFNDVDRKILATKDPFWSNIHGLSIFILLTILVADFFAVLFDSSIINTLFNCQPVGESNAIGNSCGPNQFQSLLLLDERVDTEHAMFYLGSVLIPLIWTSWAFLQEIRISKKLRNARIDLLLGRMNENSDGSWSDTRQANTPPEQESSNEPATFEQVLAAMDLELKKAIQAADELKIELDETKEKVVVLEEEVQEKNLEINQIKETKTNFDKILNESSSDDESNKSLSLTDSVMVGDSVMGGVKIDKQINNDPEAIAKAVIDAYRKGMSDSS